MAAAAEEVHSLFEYRATRPVQTPSRGKSGFLADSRKNRIRSRSKEPALSPRNVLGGMQSHQALRTRQEFVSAGKNLPGKIRLRRSLKWVSLETQ
ncbi:MAG: hypothetical protein U1E83_10920 [Methylotetracoccus sp.]